MKPKERTATCTITIDPLTGTPRILNAKGKEANLFQMLGYLFVAGFYGLYQLFTGAEHDEMSPEDFAAYLENTKLEVKQDKNGYCFLAIAGTDESSSLPLDFGTSYHDIAQQPPQTTIVEKKQGTTIIYQIQNLNVYLTAEVITQLNMNPEKVMNIIHDNVKAEIDKIEKTEFKITTPKNCP